MKYILTKFIRDQIDPLDKQFRGSFLFESTQDMIRFAEDDRTQAGSFSSAKVSDDKFELDEELLCPCKASEIMRMSRPLMYYTVGSYIVEFYVSLVNRDENASAYESLLNKHELSDKLNIKNCFIESVSLGTFTSAYDYIDHGYMDLMLMVENTYSESILEKANHPVVNLPIRIFVETTSTEKQHELFHVLRGFRMDVERYIRRIQNDPDPKAGMYCCSLKIHDNTIVLSYKTESGGGCSHRPASRILYQFLKKGSK